MWPFSLHMFKDIEIKKETMIRSIGKAVGSRPLLYAADRTAFLGGQFGKSLYVCLLGKGVCVPFDILVPVARIYSNSLIVDV